MIDIVYWACQFALGCFVLGMCCAVIRLLKGPSAADRVLALDTMYINGMLALLALGIRFDSTLYFDIALLMALFGFFSTTVMAKFLYKGEVIQP